MIPRRYLIIGRFKWGEKERNLSWINIFFKKTTEILKKKKNTRKTSVTAESKPRHEACGDRFGVSIRRPDTRTRSDFSL